ncbi:uncharacterized protein LOC123225956 isoform X2 [Mangifera indica]|uniref:uncharacterized protein LOC123225956 isoform X2 n=1 Tax=Mangifera indica TaxID=29780 RepID=UPI001CFC098E|nr:uncharacterized protein LOC123225956 isoform X2 [Mangifera indica]
MIHKRHFADEESFEFPCKNPKLCDYANNLAPIIDFSPSNNAAVEPQTSDRASHNFSECQDQMAFLFDSVTEDSNGIDEECEIGTSACISQFLWENSSIAESDAKFGAAFHLSFFPEYFAPQHHLRALLQPEETYSSLLEATPLIPVSIGTEHQADVPEWKPRGSKSFMDNLDVSGHQVELAPLSDFSLDDVGDEEKLMGTCVISMPDYETSANYCSERCGTRNDCKCIDRGSIDCVRQHVMEAREKLRQNLGEKIFEELGFCEMGEELSKRWTEEEEQSFHEAVFSNPASLGKNFWDCLSLVFPSQTKKDLVSYYFNVFMLQKCAEQNRFDPQNVDSDNDEWQINEHEAGAAEEDEYSGVESPTNQDAPPSQEDHADDGHDDIEGDNKLDDFKDGAQVVSIVATDEDEGDVDDISIQVKNSFGDSGGNTELHHSSKIQRSYR